MAAPQEKLHPNHSIGPGIHRPRNPVDATTWHFFSEFVGPTEIKGVEHLRAAVELWKQGSPIVVAPRHISNLDALKLDAKLHTLAPEFAHELFYIKGNRLKLEPLAEYVSHTFNTMEITPKDGMSPDRNVRHIQMLRNGEAITKARSWQEKGHPCAVFLEGGRSRDGALRQADPYIVEAFFLPDTVVLPVALQGTDEALPIGATLPKWHTPISIEFGTLIYTKEIRSRFPNEPKRQSAEITTAVMHALRDMLPEDQHGAYKRT